MGRAAILLPLAVVVLGGCLEDPQASAIGAPASSAAAFRSLDFDDCQGLMFVGRIPATWVQDRLPEGYVAFGGASVQGLPLEAPVGPAPLATAAYACDGVVLADGTRLEGIRLGFTSTYLRAAAGHELDEGANFYVFEVFLEETADPALATHFQAFGWKVHPAQITLETGGFHVVSSDGIDYDAMANDPTWNPEATLSTEPRHERYHAVSDGGEPSFGTLGDTEYRGFADQASTLRAEGGLYGGLGEPVSHPQPFTGVLQPMGFDGPSVLQWA